MNKALKAELNRTSNAPAARVYTCALCPGEITVADSARGDLMTVNIDGHAKAAHRVCPDTDTGEALEVIETREPGSGAPITLEVGDRVRITIEATVGDLEDGFLGPSPTFVTATDKVGFKLVHSAMRAARIERLAPIVEG